MILSILVSMAMSAVSDGKTAAPDSSSALRSFTPELAGKVGIGLSVGATQYQGELGEGFDGLARGWIKWNPAERFGLRLTGTYFALRDNADKFRTHASEASLSMVLQPRWGRFRPYVAAGAGMASAQAFKELWGKGAPAVDHWILTAPVEAGFEILLTEEISISAWADGYAWTDPDDVFDGEDRGGDSHFDRRDEVRRAGVGLTFYLDPVRDADHDGIPDKLDRCITTPEDVDGFLDTDGCPDPDNDRDGIADLRDRCPNEPEDVDGFEDADGCPDLDNDKDGVPDSLDKCPLEKEDRDGFEDIDGCPDLDNDKDGVLDSLDKCPLEIEDRDGFQDTDGCPDLDNDKDGIPDSIDRCPLEPEDRDGFQDEDGCPEPDNDLDGIPDTQDKCPNEKETVNGLMDEDGCPDVAVKAGQSMILDGIEFKEGSAEILPVSRPILEKAAESLLGVADALVEIRGYTDNLGNDRVNQILSQRRAESVRLFLIGLGVRPEQLQAKGFGRLNPIAPNKTAEGRGRNRRIEFFRIR